MRRLIAIDREMRERCSSLQNDPQFVKCSSILHVVVSMNKLTSDLVVWCTFLPVYTWALVRQRQPQARLKIACYNKTALYRFRVVAGALVEINGEFHDKLFIRSLKTEETSASSASMLATPLKNILTYTVSFMVFSCMLHSARMDDTHQKVE